MHKPFGNSSCHGEGKTVQYAVSVCVCVLGWDQHGRPLPEQRQRSMRGSIHAFNLENLSCMASSASRQPYDNFRCLSTRHIHTHTRLPSLGKTIQKLAHKYTYMCLATQTHDTREWWHINLLLTTWSLSVIYPIVSLALVWWWCWIVLVDAMMLWIVCVSMTDSSNGMHCCGGDRSSNERVRVRCWWLRKMGWVHMEAGDGGDQTYPVVRTSGIDTKCWCHDGSVTGNVDGSASASAEALV